MLLIKQIYWFSLLVFGFNTPNGTSDDGVLTPAELEKRTVSDENLILNPNQGIVFYKDEPFTGTGIATYPNGLVSEKITYLNGKRDGVLQRWFENGLLSFEANYERNSLNGMVKSWWSNGKLRSEANFQHGLVHGVQKQWYSSGQLFKVLHIVEGKEEGLQQAWRENGKLFVNYEAKDGRIYGLKRASLCYELEGENIVIDE
ncbi:toxin-antitoxin system YwqK family antitoxin [Cyclobacterium amurskyense]|uniref:toxin-antitoxin system YwqK family antitoxin n=1 Tax=Cyclobacterium amurskyense TaxID=320787 RepID=UPI0030DD84CF|tara:strand:- start:4483 stop:5088 length:606 start_codon:yes stop_codon:yes gene_type:complete